MHALPWNIKIINNSKAQIVCDSLEKRGLESRFVVEPIDQIAGKDKWDTFLTSGCGALTSNVGNEPTVQNQQQLDLGYNTHSLFRT